MGTRSLAITILIDTDDTRLYPEQLAEAPIDTEALHAIVIAAAPKLRRVVSIMDESECDVMHMASIAADVIERMVDQVNRAEEELPPPNRRH